MRALILPLVVGLAIALAAIPAHAYLRLDGPVPCCSNQYIAYGSQYAPYYTTGYATPYAYNPPDGTYQTIAYGGPAGSGYFYTESGPGYSVVRASMHQRNGYCLGNGCDTWYGGYRSGPYGNWCGSYWCDPNWNEHYNAVYDSTARNYYPYGGPTTYGPAYW